MKTFNVIYNFYCIPQEFIQEKIELRFARRMRQEYRKIVMEELRKIHLISE